MKYKLVAFVLAFSCLAIPVEAKRGGGNNNKAAEEERKRKEEERKAREERRDAIKEYLAKKDLNRDGSLTLDEFLTGESDKDAAALQFNQYNKNKDRYLSKGEIEELLGL